MMYLRRADLESANADEAVAYLKQAHFAQAMNYLIGDREKVVSVETWQNSATVLNIYEGTFAVHTNHSLGKDTPKTFEMTSEMGGGSYGFSQERLALGMERLGANTAGITREDFQQLFKTRPVLVHPGKPTGRTLMNMVAEIPQEGSPILYLTPDSPNMFAHARFTF